MSRYHHLPSQQLEMARAQAARQRQLLVALRQAATVVTPADPEHFADRLAMHEGEAEEYEALARTIEDRSRIGCGLPEQLVQA